MNLQTNHVLLLLAMLGLSTRARAFSDPLSYPDAVDVGGGAGRWFSGSVADGYGCEVCHAGGAPADLSIRGIPLDGFAPGVAYEVSVTWPLEVENASLIAEFVDEQLHAAGALALPRPDAMKPDELCAADQGGVPPAALHPTEEGRTLLSLVDCGAKSLRFQWTAPLSAAAPIWFDLGFVASNEDATPAGDGVTMVRRPLKGVRSDPGPRVIAQGCTSVAGSHGSGWWVLVFGLAALRRVRSRAESNRCR